jgi:hypothetical protein
MQPLQASINTDLSWLSAFANNPITLAILMIAVVIIFFIWKGLPFVKEIKLNAFGKIENIENNILEIKEENKKQGTAICNVTKDTLRMTIYQNELDITERLIAAKRYLSIGGNGQTQKYIEEILIKENEALWNSLQRLQFDKQYNNDN